MYEPSANSTVSFVLIDFSGFAVALRIVKPRQPFGYLPSASSRLCVVVVDGILPGGRCLILNSISGVKNHGKYYNIALLFTHARHFVNHEYSIIEASIVMDNPY
jgi:hypothetical protein